MSTAVALNDQQPRLPTMNAGGAVKAIVPQNFEDAWRIASAVVKAGMAPRGLETAEKAMVAIMHGLEVGLTPMNALQSIAVVNGRPTIWGDGAIGLARGSGLLEWMDEKFEGEEGKDNFTAVCLVKRRGEPNPTRSEFSIAEAKTAGLWTKRGRDGQPTPWQLYPKRMLKMRARAFALRDGFADVLKGLSIKEEVEDYQIKGDTPRDEPPAPPPLPMPGPTATIPSPNAPSPLLSIDPPAPIPDPFTPIAPVGETIPDVGTDLDGFIKFMFAKFAAAKTAEELNELWETHVEPAKAALFPPDEEDLMGAYRRREGELS